MVSPTLAQDCGVNRTTSLPPASVMISAPGVDVNNVVPSGSGWLLKRSPFLVNVASGGTETAV